MIYLFFWSSIGPKEIVERYMHGSVVAVKVGVVEHVEVITTSRPLKAIMKKIRSYEYFKC